VQCEVSLRQDGKVQLPASSVANRFLALGLNQPNQAHQACNAPGTPSPKSIPCPLQHLA
jgi:hypothetical protein